MSHTVARVKFANPPYATRQGRSNAQCSACVLLKLVGCRLVILLPVTSRGPASRSVHTVIEGLKTLAASLHLPQVKQPAPEGSDHPLHTAASNTTSCSSNSNDPLLVMIGVDSDNVALLQREQQLCEPFTSAGVPAQVLLFSEADRASHGPGAVCHLWGIMAKAAIKEGCDLAVLLGDDTEVQPAGWPQEVLSAFEQDPQLMLLLLKDGADPGFPSFPVLRVSTHLKLFGELLPDCFVNQGGDPYLAALYRRWEGCVRMLPDVTVTNHIGGVQRAEQPYTEPCYIRWPVSKQKVLEELRRGTSLLAAAASAIKPADGMRSAFIDKPVTSHTSSVNVSADQAPCGDSGPSSSSNSNSSSTVGDTSPISSAGPVAAVSSSALGSDLPGCSDGHQLCLSGGNTLHSGWSRQSTVDVLVPTARLDLNLLEGIAQAVLSSPGSPGVHFSLILVVDQPLNTVSPDQALWLQRLQAKWLDRVRVRFNECNMGASATRNRALQALGFAGPSYIPRNPGSLWCCAVHQADVLFFWDAAENWGVSEVMPWAVTANVAFVNTAAVFDLSFPKTGGGEDIDYCLQVTGGRLVPVPEASVHHPLWNNGRRCYNRFFGWALGDGALIAMYPQLCYWSAPNSAEACAALLLLSGTAAAAAAFLVVMASLASTCFIYGSQLWSAGVFAGQAPAARAVAGISHSAAWWFGAAGTAGSMAGCCSTVLLAAAVALKLMDVVLDVARAFTPERLMKHPCNSWWLRTAAAVEASLIKTWSECGRLWGLWSRQELLKGTLCRRFDWFGGLSAEIVTAERRSALWRFMLCGGAALGVGVAAACTMCPWACD